MAERLLYFFTTTAPSEIYTLSLHDALPISDGASAISLTATAIDLIRRDHLRRSDRQDWAPWHALHFSALTPVNAQDHFSVVRELFFHLGGNYENLQILDCTIHRRRAVERHCGGTNPSAG